ncbi:MAG: bifunctional 5,10-methylenetetrahydrofolate dehydrogenase/5,10-methenyltetrahydrofolate cyclohydrolase [Clostridiales Family XIII bacterium]|jgi:methylenetetrahydrofolate dehydrogenase (NADP+)/methenyltetrahydrofolate cyclohydrolase|nr:bifunctional 5,10-methylenetetrahydrofolate dehydrogenase/5,10-methenyltetrahydrofolate cyclohydrolase [Clostridiales Family XIII bacterium]
MGVRLEGKKIVESLRAELKARIETLGRRGVTPSVLILRVGEREDDIAYERGILRSCGALGINSRVDELTQDISTNELIRVIESANKDSSVHGIMLFRPLPAHLDQDLISKAIAPEKDIDCMSPLNLEKVFEGKTSGFAPCTPKAVVETLKGYEIPLAGANIAIAGRSMVVGKPLAMLLLNENATVTICHSKTEDMAAVTGNADIVVAAIGKAKFMGEEYFNPDSIVIDVGINDAGDGKICGDVDYENVFGQVKAITPAVGGLGAVTTAILLSHVVEACERLT